MDAARKLVVIRGRSGGLHGCPWSTLECLIVKSLVLRYHPPTPRPCWSWPNGEREAEEPCLCERGTIRLLTGLTSASNQSDEYLQPANSVPSWPDVRGCHAVGSNSWRLRLAGSGGRRGVGDQWISGIGLARAQAQGQRQGPALTSEPRRTRADGADGLGWGLKGWPGDLTPGGMPHRVRLRRCWWTERNGNWMGHRGSCWSRWQHPGQRIDPFRPHNCKSSRFCNSKSTGRQGLPSLQMQGNKQGCPGHRPRDWSRAQTILNWEGAARRQGG